MGDTIYPFFHLARKHNGSRYTDDAMLLYRWMESNAGRLIMFSHGSGSSRFSPRNNTKVKFIGIEQRQHLVDLASKLSVFYGLYNVKYIHSNITNIRFSDYNAFYLYNSFYETVDLPNRIDDTVRLSIELYNAYSLHTVEKLSGLPTGGRLATYHTPLTLVPGNFRLMDSLHAAYLDLWEKEF